MQRLFKMAEKIYPYKDCPEDRKRAIKTKAGMFIVKDGVMFFKKKKEHRVRL